jgi:hypothetical protein
VFSRERAGDGEKRDGEKSVQQGKSGRWAEGGGKRGGRGRQTGGRDWGFCFLPPPKRALKERSAA